MRQAPNVKTTGKLPTKAMDTNTSYDDNMTMTAAHCLWAGCLDAPNSMPAGSVAKFSQPLASVSYAAVAFRDKG